MSTNSRFIPMVMSVFALFFTNHVVAMDICLQDELGEKIHINLHPNGQMNGYSEFGGEVTGTAFGSYKWISDTEVMLGGDVNNDCSFGLHPGKFNARLDLQKNTGSAIGVLFICGTGTVVPFTSAIFPCGDNPGEPGVWGIYRERKVP